MRKLFVVFSGLIYKNLLRPLIFLFNSEVIHEFFTSFGEILGKKPINKLPAVFFSQIDKNLNQTLFGIEFNSPIGLSAGFDYEAKLMDILPSVGFGFETIGTITNMPYEGNPKPRLGRLVKTRSLMVNKGFKNDGIKIISQKLKNRKFKIPIGISIGKTNTTKIKTQKEAVEDIISAFKIAENYKLNNCYYELNISCPNLIGNIEFYEPQKLEQLLKEINLLRLSKPVFIKMPISKTNDEIIGIMDVVVKYPFISAAIFGNLQKDRTDKSFIKEELRKYPIGNFSGKPTEKRSNELIKLVYQKYGKQIKIIGCGGVFNAKDAYEKIKLGASLVQLITGLVFEGPQLVAQINYDLVDLIKKDGFNNISESIGSGIK